MQIGQAQSDSLSVTFPYTFRPVKCTLSHLFNLKEFPPFLKNLAELPSVFSFKGSQLVLISEQLLMSKLGQLKEHSTTSCHQLK